MSQRAECESPHPPQVIAALATAPGPAAIGIVRLSGEGALRLAALCLSGLPTPLPPRQLVRASLTDAESFHLDDVLVAHFPAPGSYTGEETLEIFCHGGVAIARAVERRIFEVGARRATPGEFTARAVQNGKMDLLEAEALAALLAADDDEALSVARSAGEAAASLRKQADALRRAVAEARGTLDYPRETRGLPVAARDTALAVRASLEQLARGPSLETSQREGIRTALLGPPNAGKSSLFNALIEEDRALVDAEPGTTRDAQPAFLPRGLRRTTVIDTAGIRETSGLEARGVARALQVGREAELRVWVEDGSVPPVLPPAELLPVLCVVNKSDLPEHPARAGTRGFRTSSVTGAGVGRLRDEIAARGASQSSGLSGRQQRWVNLAIEALASVGAERDEGIVLQAMQRALAALETLTPSQVSPDDEVFARFCVGK